MLAKGLGVAAVASAGAGALLELSGGTAQASSIKPGVFASSTAGTPAVKATGTNGADGVDASSDSGDAVFGSSSSGNGVIGESNSGIGTVGSSGTGIGIFGQSNSGDGVSGTSFSGNAIHGQSASNLARAGLFDGDVQVNGNFSVSGTKAFVQAHPTDPSREIVYVALEGGEAGTYVRGSGQLQSGKAVLALPEHFGLVTDTEGLTVQLTPRSEWLQLYVVELDTVQLVVREAQGKSGTFDYFICGVRRGYEQYEVIRTKR
jgi:hypothetical protein